MGGTWYASKYPGIACDVESHVYSMSSYLDHSWKKTQSDGADIQNYFLKLAKKYNLLTRCKFNTEVVSAVWNENTKKWDLTLKTGEKLSANFLIGATGYYTKSFKPKFNGQDDFQGRIVQKFKKTQAKANKGDFIHVLFYKFL